MSRENTLAARVKAVNAANAYAMKLYPVLMDFFRPLLGQQILKVDGTLLKKIEAAMPAFPDSGVSQNRLHVYRNTSDYSLAWTVKTCESIEGASSCVYHEIAVYVGGLSGGTLKDFYAPPDLRSDYKVEDVKAARAAYEAAQRTADNLKSALHPFGVGDR